MWNQRILFLGTIYRVNRGRKQGFVYKRYDTSIVSDRNELTPRFILEMFFIQWSCYTCLYMFTIWTGTNDRTPTWILLGFRVSTQIRTKLGPWRILGCFTNGHPYGDDSWSQQMGVYAIPQWIPMNPKAWMDQSWGIITYRYLLYVSVCCHLVSWPVMSVTFTAPAFVPSFQFTLFRKAAMCSDEPGRVSKCSAKARKAPAVTKVVASPRRGNVTGAVNPYFPPLMYRK